MVYGGSGEFSLLTELFAFYRDFFMIVIKISRFFFRFPFCTYEWREESHQLSIYSLHSLNFWALN